MYPYLFENRNFFLRLRKNSRQLIAFLPVHMHTMNRFENDNLPDCACLTHTRSLLRAREIINWRLLGISLMWVYIVVTFFKVAETV